MELIDMEDSMIKNTMLGIEDRKKLFRWLSKQNNLVVFEVFKLKKNHFHKLKAENANYDLILIDMLAFYLAMKEFVANSKLPTRKSRSTNFSFLKKVAKNQAMQHKKVRKSPKREKLLDMQNNIIFWIEDGLSDRQIAKMISETKKFTVSHTEISSFHKLLKEQKYVEN